MSHLSEGKQCKTLEKGLQCILATSVFYFVASPLQYFSRVLCCQRVVRWMHTFSEVAFGMVCTLGIDKYTCIFSLFKIKFYNHPAFTYWWSRIQLTGGHLTILTIWFIRHKVMARHIRIIFCNVLNWCGVLSQLFILRRPRSTNHDLIFHIVSVFDQDVSFLSFMFKYLNWLCNQQLFCLRRATSFIFTAKW